MAIAPMKPKAAREVERKVEPEAAVTVETREDRRAGPRAAAPKVEPSVAATVELRDAWPQAAAPMEPRAVRKAAQTVEATAELEVAATLEPRAAWRRRLRRWSRGLCGRLRRQSRRRSN